MTLAERRKERGLSQRALAERSGVSAATIADIERGTVIGAPSTWARLEAFFAAPAVREPAAAVAVTEDVAQGAAFAEVRLLEGLSVGAMARLMGCRKAEVVSLEAGELRLMEVGWQALERHKRTCIGVLTRRMCGFCGAIHAYGPCP